MLAAVADHYGIALRDVEIPSCPTDGVLIDVMLCGICGSDLLLASGAREPPPFPLGHEYVGIVRAVGPLAAQNGVLQIGQRVCVNSVTHCGDCRHCEEGRGNLCRQRVFVPFAGPGGLGPVALAHWSTVVPVPPSLSNTAAALAEPFAVALHAMGQFPEVPTRLLLVGAGTVGLAAIRCAKQLGVEHIDVVARYPHQADLARASGARVLTPDELIAETYEQAIVSVVGDALDLAIAACARRATIVTAAGYSVPQQVSLRSVVSKELRLMGSICADLSELELAIQWLADGWVDTSGLVTHTFDLSDIRDAFAVAADKATGSVKVQVRVGESDP